MTGADASRTAERDPGDAARRRKYAISPDCDEREFLAVAKLYAREVVDAYDLNASVNDLDWQISTRAKRRAGAVFYRDGVPRAVQLTWEHFEREGWDATASTIRHELIHVHLLNEAGDPSHGPRFRRLAEQLDADVHCEEFADPKWLVTCEDCGTELARFKRSKLVKRPEEFGCGECGGRLRVSRNE